jgi:hypothetical protein
MAHIFIDTTRSPTPVVTWDAARGLRGSPADFQVTVVKLPADSGSRSGYYCEYYLAKGVDVQNPNVTISWTGTNATGAFQGQFQIATDDAHSQAALDYIRQLWNTYA